MVEPMRLGWVVLALALACAMATMLIGAALTGGFR
jgi:hypothetical protein